MTTATEPEVTIYANREKWFADMNVGPPDYCLGASSIAAILGISKWQSPWDVWARSRQQGRQDTNNAVQARGHRWEPYLLDQYAPRIPRGFKLGRQICRVKDPDRPWLRVSPDDLVWDKLAALAGSVEVKTSARADNWGEDGQIIQTWDTEGARAIPSYYSVQGMVQAHVCRVPWVDFIVGTPDPQELVAVRIIRLVAQPDRAEKILAYVEDWRDKHLVRGEVPQVDGSSESLHWIAEQARGAQYLQASDDQAQTIREFRKIGKQLKELEERKRALSAELLSAAGDSIGIQAGSLKARVVTMPGSRSLSLDRLEKAHPEWVEQLELDGVISTGRASAHIRIYGEE